MAHLNKRASLHNSLSNLERDMSFRAAMNMSASSWCSGGSGSEPCPKINIEELLSLEETRKMLRQGSFLNTENVPRRNILKDNKIVDYLMSQGFTLGLARSLIRSTDNFPLRIWLVNNASTMNAMDGHLVNVKAHSSRIQNKSCSRWEEVCSTVQWHAKFWALMEAPTIFRLLKEPRSKNGTLPNQQVGVATIPEVDQISDELFELKGLMETTPFGAAPLIPHLREVVESLLVTERSLLEERSIAIVIVTDSLPTDVNGVETEDARHEFMNTLSLLEGLPVWVVLRLGTDDKRVVDFYHNLDSNMEAMLASTGSALPSSSSSQQDDSLESSVHLDVIDDFVSEAEQIFAVNPWLNYVYPLHLCRESAVNFPAFDAINDRPLQPDELRAFITLLFDRTSTAWGHQPLPNPKADYRAFRKEVLDLVTRAGMLYNPIKRRILPWIDMRELDRIYSPSGTGPVVNPSIRRRKSRRLFKRRLVR